MKPRPHTEVWGRVGRGWGFVNPQQVKGYRLQVVQSVSQEYSQPARRGTWDTTRSVHLLLRWCIPLPPELPLRIFL